uniref:Uncharacterized protein n=1 Tax=Cucumis melo subsp. melo TaxID=412675 RepID=E5GB58_CUCME|nr:hypothetical protein [Cucumis melo subsp. melo]
MPVQLNWKILHPLDSTRRLTLIFCPPTPTAHVVSRVTLNHSH